MKRILQFWRAMTAHLNTADFEFINMYLNDEEKNLFFAMRLYDQRHVLNVAYTARRLAQKDGGSINEKLYDQFQDSVLQMDDVPVLVEDYINDLKEMVLP